MEERHLSLATVAGRLGVSERTVRRWIKAGKLKAYRPGRDYRIPESAFRAFVEESEIDPKAERRSSLEPTFNDVLADERQARASAAFIRRVEEHVQARVAHYERRLAEAEQGDVAPLRGYEGAVLLSDDAWGEFTHLADLINGELAERWATNPEILEEVTVALARAVGRILETFLEIVRRIAVREWDLAETAAQEERAERRREEIREQTRRMSAA